MDNQLMFDAIEGKTIKRVFGDYTDKILLVFDDKSFCVLYGYASVDDDVTLENGDFRLSDWGKYADELFALGVVSQKKLDKHKEDQERQSAAWKEARRLQFEALKSEFESA
jgi:hypothetical protein